MPHTKGFMDRVRWLDHFQSHGHEFGAVDENDYLRMADEFFDMNRPAHVLEGVRRHGPRRGDVLRFDPATNAFGVRRADGNIRTFFKPVPCASLAAHIAEVLRALGECHPKASNLVYFHAECLKP